MNEKYKLIPKIAFILLMVLSVIVILGYMIMMFLNISEGTLDVAGDIMSIPLFTGGYIGWAYALAGIAALAALVALCNLLVHLFRKDPKRALLYLCIAFGYVVVLPIICWCISSGDRIDIIGYEGSDNVGFWVRLSETMLYWTYIAVATAFGAGIWAFARMITKK